MLLVFLLALSAPSLPKELSALESAYDDTEFEEAIGKGNRLLMRELTTPQRLRVHTLLAFSYFYLGKKEQSETELRAVLKLNEAFDLDRKKVTPELGQFFDEVRLRWLESTKPKDTAVVAKPDASVGAQPSDNTPPPAPVQVKPAFRAVTLIPFGIGQLAIGDYAAGVTFLVLDVALIATSVALYWVRENEKVNKSTAYKDPARAAAMQISQNVMAFAAIAVGVIGFIDALAFSPGRMAAKEAVQLQPTVAPTAGGATVGLAGSF
jgi:hypothetical protein